MIYRFGDCELDDQRYELRRGGALVHLEPQVLEVLAYLARHRDRVVPKAELLDQICGNRFLAPVQLRGAEPREAGLEAAPAPIGREAELALLGELHRLADGGRRQVVFVTGEAGIGKTTLVDAFAGATAGRVARGQCLEQRGAPEPYLPVFDALDRLCRDDAEALGWLCRLGPTWLAQMPALFGEADREDVGRRAL